MRKNIFGKKLSRNKNQRQALFKNLVTSLISYGKIETTQAKSLAVKGLVDKVVSAAKNGSLAKRRYLLSLLPKETTEKLMLDVVPRFSNRQSGFTKIIKTGARFSDNAPMVIMQWTDEAKAEVVTKPTQGNLPAKKFSHRRIATAAKTKKKVTKNKTIKKK